MEKPSTSPMEKERTSRMEKARTSRMEKPSTSQMEKPRASHKLWLRRIGWLAALWTGSVAALAAAALLLRMLMSLAGMTP